MSFKETPLCWDASISSPMSLGFLLGVRCFDHCRPVSRRLVGEQRLAQPAAVVRDQSGGDREDVAARAIVSLEPDHLCAGKVPLEAQDVFDVGAAPGVDRLIVVADAAQIAVRSGEEAEPEILDDVGVLVLVNQNVAKPAPERRENVVVLAHESQRLEQEIAEINGVQRFQTRLIALVERRPSSAGECRRFARRRVRRIQAAILPSVDEIRERSRRPAFFVQVIRLEELLEQAQLVIGVEDGEIRSQAHKLGMHAQDLGADRMERAEPRHALFGPGEGGDAHPHLPRRLVGEGHRQDFVGASAAGGDEMRDPGGQDARLADARPGENENRPVERLDRAPLLLVQAVEVRIVLRATNERSRVGSVARRRRRDGGRPGWF